MSDSPNDKITPFQLIIVVLSVYVLLVLLIETIFTLPPSVQQLLLHVDNAICVVFLIDFFGRFFRSKNKLGFMKWGWLDLISSIPNLEYFRAGRLARLVRLLRILRAFRSIKVLVHFIFQHRRESTFSIALTFSFLVYVFSSIAILSVETDPNSNIKSAEDALWWGFVTLTTVGYGDKYPVTTEGRMIAAVLMIVGVGFFGTFAGYISSWFVSLRKDEDQRRAKEEMIEQEEKMKAMIENQTKSQTNPVSDKIENP